MAKFKDRFKELRLTVRPNQKEAAAVIGISERSLQSYERGERYPDFRGLIYLADYFNVSLDYLVGRSDVKERR